MRITGCILAAVLLCDGVAQSPYKTAEAPVDNIFAADEFVAKGGIGIVNTSLYIDVRSPRNELRLSAGKRWTGKHVPQPEVVIFFANKIWSPQCPGSA